MAVTNTPMFPSPGGATAGATHSTTSTGGNPYAGAGFVSPWDPGGPAYMPGTTRAGFGGPLSGAGMPLGMNMNMTSTSLMSGLAANLNAINANVDLESIRAAGATTGGGSIDTEGNMDANALIALNPYLEKNVTSFNYGGKMNKPNYNMGGSYLQQANQAIAMNQLGGLVGNLMNKRTAMLAKGGEFKPHMMYNPKTGEGYKANKLQDHLDMKKKGYDHRKRNPDNYPKAAHGMKMKNYTQGGKF